VLAEGAGVAHMAFAEGAHVAHLAAAVSAAGQSAWLGHPPRGCRRCGCCRRRCRRCRKADIREAALCWIGGHD